MRSNDRTRLRGDRLLPCVLYRPSPPRHGGCCATPSSSRTQAKTTTPSGVQLRPSVLGGAPPFVAGLGEPSDHRETRYRRVLAPCWISAILATAIPSWGAPRIRGELLQLGFEISEPTVSRY